MLLLIKDDIMFEPVMDFSLWSRIKENDDTYYMWCVDWM